MITKYLLILKVISSQIVVKKSDQLCYQMIRKLTPKVLFYSQIIGSSQIHLLHSTKDFVYDIGKEKLQALKIRISSSPLKTY